MSQGIPDTVLARLSAVLTAVMGLRFPQERWRNLEMGIESAAREFGFEDTASCIDWLMTSNLTRRQVETLASFLTVGETYFFRDSRTLEIFEREILPDLIRLRRAGERRLRIWSAGCSSGEEPYSIAVLLHRTLPDLAQWQITILATDINTASLRKGMDGVYGAWSFRGTPPWFRELYFRPVGAGRYEIAPQIRRMVSFAYLNLAEEAYPSLASNTNAMDVIFCRNVLMYFAPHLAQAVVGRLHRSLVENGWLIVSPAEVSRTLYAPFQEVYFAGSTVYRKEGEARLPPATAEAALPAAPAIPSAAGGAAPGPSRYQLAVSLYRRGHYPEACALLTKPCSRGEGTLAEFSLLVRSNANQGSLSDALRWCEAALRMEKLDAELYCLRAAILQEQGEIGGARASLERALFLDPTLVLAHVSLGYLALWGGKGDQARRHFQNALRLIASAADGDILPGSEGMTAGRLRETILRMTAASGAAGRTEGD